MKKNVLLVIVLSSMYACVPTVNYLSVSVAEEGAVKLTQYTREDEKIIGPNIETSKTTKVLVWYAPQLIAVSPDGTKIAYIARNNNFDNMYIRDISGGKSVIQRTFNRDIRDMSYSPDGKYIAFTDYKNLNWNIFMLNANEGVAVQQLVSTDATELSPSFSKDGKTIFFAKSDGTGGYSVWSTNLETSLTTQYTEGFTPSISPNGNDLIVTRNSKDGARGEIWMINIEKGIETLILSDPKKGFSSPRLSPDGKKIICVGTTTSDKSKFQNLDLYLVNLDGSKLTQLTYHFGHDVSPVWTPDGKSIFFISQRGNKEGKFNIWKMDFNNN